MKKLLLLLILFISVNLNAQLDSSLFAINTEIRNVNDSNSNKYVDYKLELIYDSMVPFLVGSNKISGYKLEIRNCIDDESSILSNGRKIAGLSCILFECEEYLGGKMIFGNDTTNILGMSIEPLDSCALFIVKGKDFSMGFTLVSGFILKYENNYSTFNTQNVGIWTIKKRL